MCNQIMEKWILFSFFLVEPGQDLSSYPGSSGVTGGPPPPSLPHHIPPNSEHLPRFPGGSAGNPGGYIVPRKYLLALKNFEQLVPCEYIIANMAKSLRSLLLLIPWVTKSKTSNRWRTLTNQKNFHSHHGQFNLSQIQILCSVWVCLFNAYTKYVW